MKSISIKVRGKVQGVWFRASTGEMALKLGVNGIVRNERDGSVYIEAEGDVQAIAKLITWCNQGPEFAEVQSIEVEEIQARGFEKFEIAE